MTRFLLLAGAAAIAAAAPAVAKGGHGHSTTHSTTTTIMHPNGYETHTRSVTKSSSSKTTMKVHAPKAHEMAFGNKYGGAACPPGLAKKSPACMPPGQAKKLFREGERVPVEYKHYTPYGSIPGPLVNRYGLTDRNHYIYRQNVIYVVDPVTHRVTRVIKAT
jgi:hypothetical protein